jgi:hypothetical protein
VAPHHRGRRGQPTEDKSGWRERKEQYLHAPARASAPGLWDRFPGKTPDDHLWYYGSLAAIFGQGLHGPLAGRLRGTVEAMAALHRTLLAGPASEDS